MANSARQRKLSQGKLAENEFLFVSVGYIKRKRREKRKRKERKLRKISVETKRDTGLWNGSRRERSDGKIEGCRVTGLFYCGLSSAPVPCLETRRPIFRLQYCVIDKRGVATESPVVACWSSFVIDVSVLQSSNDCSWLLLLVVNSECFGNLSLLEFLEYFSIALFASPFLCFLHFIVHLRNFFLPHRCSLTIRITRYFFLFFKYFVLLSHLSVFQNICLVYYLSQEYLSRLLPFFLFRVKFRWKRANEIKMIVLENEAKFHSNRSASWHIFLLCRKWVCEQLCINGTKER